jgi:hypothetical protein
VLFLAPAAGHARGTGAGSPPSVAIVRATAWSQGDPAREGAAELVILLQIARLRQESAQGGLVAVGDRRGLFSAGAEEALRLAVLQGVPVVKLAGNGQVLPAPHGLFLDGGNLPEEDARQVLAGCLMRYGALPAVAGHGTENVGLAALRARLQLFQHDLTLAASTRVAVR